MVELTTHTSGSCVFSLRINVMNAAYTHNKQRLLLLKFNLELLFITLRIVISSKN